MRTTPGWSRILAAVVAVGLAGVACAKGASGASPTTAPTTGSTSAPPTTGATSQPSSGPSPVHTESPVPVESNPPGDIPDSTVYVAYRSAGGHFQIKVPEGWSRRTASSSVSFASKLNSVTVTWGKSSTAGNPSSVKRHEVPKLASTERAFQLQSVKQVSLPGGRAVLVQFRANSAPNSVTGKQYRLVVLRFDFFRNGVEASLDLSSPVGADNVDPWRIVSESFRWQ